MLAKGLRDEGHEILNPLFYDTLKIKPKVSHQEIRERAIQKEINLRYYDDGCVSTTDGSGTINAARFSIASDTYGDGLHIITASL